jgi:uncharacterized membrane-anchored protein
MQIPVDFTRVMHWVMFFDPTETLELPSTIDPTQRHQQLPINQGRLRFERHTEFFALTWAGQNHPSGDVLDLLNSLPGQLLAGAEICFANAQEHSCNHFGSSINGGTVTVSGDFKLNENLLNPFVISGHFDNDFARSKIVKNLLDIETYRMAALLSLPMIRSQTASLQQLEKSSSTIASELRQCDRDSLSNVVDTLAELQAELGVLAESVRYRLAASHAYFDLVQDRLSNLNECAADFQETLKSFIDQRLAPALKTASAFENRLEKLSARVNASMKLASTRLDVLMQEQNMQLLERMESRARQQVHLARTVEGLSTAAITYYSIGLLGYLLKGVPDFAAVSDAAIIAAAVPIIALSVWSMTRKATAHLFKENPL